MIELSAFLWFNILLFGVIGYMRGFSKEFVALAGIILALFVLVEFESFFETLGRGSGSEQIFYVKALFLLVVTFFAYETPPERVTPSKRRGRSDNRDAWQNRILGVLLGGFNAYLVFGSLWYFMDQLAYPLSPSVSTPPPDSASAEMVSALPLVWMQQGNLLTIFVIGLFLFILIAMI
ncbi:MAG: hypothetical protein CUN55_05355 [Phototrophicales bacterium]|nr:MAG: hypothetical protein CUN55_05355 [Phototrophicales bacterium]